MARRFDERFANDIRAALVAPESFGRWPLLWIVAAMLVVFLVWAFLAGLEEVTTGIGRIVPTSQMQLVQPFEAGIVREIAVEEGAIVEQGDVLLVMDDTEASATLGELLQRQAVLQTRRARLLAEARGEIPVFLHVPSNGIEEGEGQLFSARLAALEQERSVISQQLSQRRLEADTLAVRTSETESALELLERELSLAERLFERRAIPEIDFLQRQRAAALERRELAVLRAEAPTAAAAIAEAEARFVNLETTFRAEAREELTGTIGDLAVIEESIRAAQERLQRTVLRAPVRGIVNALPVTTIGAVLRPGESVVEIVPLDEKLLVEVQIRPQDIAFISPGQSVSIKVTAYDYTLYGDLPGTVNRISADTFTDEQGQSFYRVFIAIEDNSIGPDSNPLPLIPGMVVTADILTGHKTVLDYLLSPLQRVRNEALRER
ncbi:MAG: HlyD family type I secretion periplasmic adaptor subunit [Hyphomicrobiaceae bacterium]|nr:HlyD family type I secretion periplasmic adaptor subunit [Hyphomicrobiaceae bacterium]